MVMSLLEVQYVMDKTIVVIDHRDPKTDHIIGPGLSYQDTPENAIAWLRAYCKEFKMYNDDYFTVSQVIIESGPWFITPKRYQELLEFQKSRYFKKLNWHAMTKELIEKR
jgi:hypothetical protein